MYNLLLARRKTILLWVSLEALFGGLAWQSYRKTPSLSLAHMRTPKQLQS
ncbi:hypothetical protein D9613_002250 [Agrocybe pediades]|uniref:Uncharacterized protein n=1 Tax=Agrocybe pediades TaxID=84607 RepID=A0A8H4R6S5_9AGAR|nr:hypothetical protein D9613_002250 [Agrocybe pediades]KAF9567001.1 hypothetical protein CPC08DRAFT_758624 [Agrocybe pediades]